MRKFITAVVILPIAIVFVAFAVANRHLVTVSFDPFNSAEPAIGLRLPLFVILIAVAIVGVLAGGIATWIRQRRWRRAAAQHEADARRARAELAGLKAEWATRQPLSGPTSSAPLRPAISALPAPGHAAGMRDNSPATL